MRGLDGGPYDLDIDFHGHPGRAESAASFGDIDDLHDAARAAVGKLHVSSKRQQQHAMNRIKIRTKRLRRMDTFILSIVNPSAFSWFPTGFLLFAIVQQSPVDCNSETGVSRDAKADLR